LRLSLDKIRFHLNSLRPVVVAAVAFALSLAPYRAAAQTSSTPSAPTASQVAATNSAVSESSKAGESEEQKFLHSSSVQALARVLHLDVQTTSKIFLGINFAIIFFAIVIPLGRLMPRVFRKRSQTLSHDLQTAREATADANTRLSAIEAKLAGLDDEMKQFREQIEQESAEDEKRIKATISEESARIVASAEQEIGVAAAHARRSLRNFAAELAIEHAEKGLKLTPEADRALIAEFVANVSADGAAKGGKN
jgi:F-type H+-transporting ATPase subunit b